MHAAMLAIGTSMGQIELSVVNHLGRQLAHGQIVTVVTPAAKQGTLTPRRRPQSWSSCSYSAMTCAPNSSSIAMISMLSSATTAVVREP